MSKKIRLKGNAERRQGPYPLGDIPDKVVLAVGKQIVHRIAVGVADISGDDFGTIFAKAVDGVHRGKPLGVADVEKDGCAWTVKTVKQGKPLAVGTVRVISGRNSPVFSSGIKDAFKDVAATGRSVLDIWNARVDEAAAEFDDLRSVVLIRNMDTLEFTLFESEAIRYVTKEFVWETNNAGNFIAHDGNKDHRFTWQPHGSQFTVITEVPASARRFRITKQPKLISEAEVLRYVGYEDSWIKLVETPTDEQSEASAGHPDDEDFTAASDSGSDE